jgi:lipoprotein-anchoring transpeptidase ErfK/SrfK
MDHDRPSDGREPTRRQALSVPITLALLPLSGLQAEARPSATPRSPVPAVDWPDMRLPAGSILVRTGARQLVFIAGDGRALRYPVAVGRAGKQWTGTKYVEEMQIAPAWAPPAVVRRDMPHLPAVIPGGDPRNPMGAAALGLGPGGEYAIHGTNQPGSIGRAASYGCFRMHNSDILDLYPRVKLGAVVVVVR